MRIRRSSKLGKLIFKVANLLYRISQELWAVIIVCNHCGRDVGFSSVVSKYGFNCWECHYRLEKK